MEDITNKEFVRQYVPFKALKKARFFDASVKAKDYDIITARVLKFFGKTKREYVLHATMFKFQISPDHVEGKFPDSIDKNGNLIKGDAFHLSL